MIDLVKRHELLCLFCLVYFVYNINFRPIPSGDTIPASLLPFSILEDHSLYFDRFYHYYAFNNYGIYFFANNGGHYLSSYPIVIPVLVTPFYVIPYVFLKLNSCPIDLFYPGFSLTVSIMEKLSASLIASVSVVFVYLALKELVPRRTSAFVALIFAFGTNTWTISSQALWQHGLGELLLAASIFLVLLNEKQASNRLIILLGTLSGLFVFNRPADAILLIPFIYYILRLNDMRIGYYIFGALLSGIPFLLYNIHYFGNLFGGYSTLLNSFDFSSEIFARLMGLLFSPSRGLFVYTPVMLLSILGFFNIFKLSSKRTKEFLLLLGVSCLAQVFMYSAFNIWWAGGCYGPRFLTDMLPALTIYLGVFINKINFNVKVRKNMVAYIAIFLILIWSLCVQFVGAFYYPSGNWDGEPNVDYHPDRLWDWKDTQITRTFNAGMVSPLNGIKSICSIPNFVRLKDIQNSDIHLKDGFHSLESWYGVPTRWMQSDATLATISTDNSSANLSLQAMSFHRTRTLEIYAGDELAARLSVPSAEFKNVTVSIPLMKGANTVRLHVPEGCERPCDIKELNNPDQRCLSIAVQNVTIRGMD